MYLPKKLIVVLLLCLPATSWSADLRYDLAVQINPMERKITGTARLRPDATQDIVLSVKDLRELKVDGKALRTPDDYRIRLRIKGGKETLISYEALYAQMENNFIDKDNVFLNEGWYPRPDLLAEYALTVTLPKDFVATSEAEAVTIGEEGETRTFHFRFQHPLETLHLAASTRYVLKKDGYDHIAIEAYFFKEDVQQADAYVEEAKKYLGIYETMLTPYPYRRFAIVENIFAIQDSMPTYTLLGAQAVHSPLAVHRSLGHEILRQWLGNAVYIDFAPGNWAEGLTSYLGEHHFAVPEEEGAAYRKNIMLAYGAYVNEDNALQLSDFRRGMNNAQQAIGYGKAAMLFHWLRKRFGDETFFAALQEFIRRNIFRRASWHDIQRAFEQATKEKLYADFGHWLTRKDIPRISSADAELGVEHGKLKLNFTLLQGGEPYPLRVPITVYTGSGKSQRLIEMRESKKLISLSLDELPTKVVIDEDYDIMRQLAPQEIPPLLASILGKEKLSVVVPPGQRQRYQPFIDALGPKNITYMPPEKVTFVQIRENSFLIAGYNNPLVDMLLGKQVVPEEGVRLKVYKNPYRETERIMLVQVKNRAEAQGVQGKLPRFDHYRELAFTRGQNTQKVVARAERGISVVTRTPVRALNPKALKTLDNVLSKIAESRIIYVGEQHDRFAHHINQLQIIKKLHEAGYQLAVGMEMFQGPYQQTVDAYLGGRIEEATFLDKSEYFYRWRYDYNLYKPIIDYLKGQGIPLVALNVERDVTRKVAREGLYSLTEEEKKHLPSAMDFSDEQYRADLEKVFRLHQGQEEIQNFEYFLQAQVLWDEGMAEVAHEFLKDNPGGKLVILAGNGHLRHRYGIPERLYRRNREPFTVIVQDEEIENGIADFVLLTTELKGKESPRLGVFVEEKEEGLVVVGVSDKTPAKHAGLQKGDVIREFAGRAIRSLAHLKLGLFYSEMGSTASIRVKRDDKILEKKIQLFPFSRSHPALPRNVLP